jgi:hypothetical protein
MGQLYWPESAGFARYSIPSQPRSSLANPFLQPTYEINSTDDHLNSPKPKLIEISESRNETSSPNDIHVLYDGLVSLNESRLDEMIETDLVSSSNG